MLPVEQLLRGASPRSTLDRPLEHLVACHDRIEERLCILERAAEHWETKPEEAQAALAAVFRHFDTAGVLHTRDEEESIFPRLNDGRLTEGETAYLTSLEEQHREAEAVYRELRASDRPRAATVQRFCALYRAHIASENAELIGLAARALSAADLTDIAREMKARRNP